MRFRKQTLLALALTLLFAPAAVLAEKGGKHGQDQESNRAERPEDRSDKPRPGKDGRRHEAAREQDRGDGDRVEFRFGEQDRRAVHDYYGSQARAGHCPPGLSKKGNGCLPPGQAKKWTTGRPLPHDVQFYEVPHDLVVRLPPPPPGHRYVRVAGDILLIAVGSSMVVDALQDVFR